MSLSAWLRQRLDAGRPVRVALIGAGKFGSMFLAQVPTIAGLEVAVIADLDPERAREACRTVGWDEERIAGMRFSADGTEASSRAIKPFHLIGSELLISVLSAALRGEPTGSCRTWRGDAVAVAKRDLKTGESLDGDGGYTVYRRLAPAARSKARRMLPIGLAHGVCLKRDVAAGSILMEDDVDLDPGRMAVQVRREMCSRHDSYEVGPDLPVTL
jgi:predicted homoserine dehydrogenase-like protein